MTEVNLSRASHSLWMDISLPSFSPLNQNLNADVVIVGSGIVGLTCAYTLLKTGKSVVLIERGSLCDGQTARTTAHLTWVLDDRFFHLEKMFGEKNTLLAVKSHMAAIDYIETIVQKEGIDCDFERISGYLFQPPEGDEETIEKEFHCLKNLGLPIEKVSRAPFSKTFDTGTCLHFRNQAQFHIIKYIKGLVNAIVKDGGKIFAHTPAVHFEDGDRCIVTTESGNTITANAVIVATCTPVNDRFTIHTKQAAYRTYVIAAAIPKNSVSKALYWDTQSIYHYLRIQRHLTHPDLDWLIIGGGDHRVGQDPAIEAKYQTLEAWAKQRFPMITGFHYHWSGQVFEPVDSLAFIGKNPDDTNTYIATGDSGNGMTHGTIAGILIPDLILGNSNAWKTIYDPSRKTLAAVADYIHENGNTALQYLDWLTPGDHEIIAQLPCEEGLILREGVKKIAVYKDKEGNLHAHSACCPHLGGAVRWNTGEKSWDCPCHGSRFDAYGQVITGPAISNLSPCTCKLVNA